MLKISSALFAIIVLVAVTGIVILIGRATPSLKTDPSVGTLAAMWPSPPPDPTNAGGHPSVPPPPPVSSPVPRPDVNQMSRAEVEAYIAEEKAKQPQVKPPDSDPPLPGWRQPIPWAHGKILHYTEMHDSWVAPVTSNGVTIENPNNGKPYLQERWEEVDETGTVIRGHSITTFLDGRFDQETVLTRDWDVLVMGCLQRDVWNGQWPGGLVPSFTTAGLLREQGFVPVDGKTEPYPTTESLPNVDPVRQFETPTDVQIWELRKGDSTGWHEVERVEIAPDGRLVGSTRQIMNGDGVLLQEYERIGPLEVYEPSEVPPSVFEVQHTEVPPCTGIPVGGI